MLLARIRWPAFIAARSSGSTGNAGDLGYAGTISVANVRNHYMGYIEKNIDRKYFLARLMAGLAGGELSAVNALKLQERTYLCD